MMLIGILKGLATFLSPYRESREFVREMAENYFEVYISTPAAICSSRDSKGVYEKAASGLMKNFPGVNAGYEVPESPDLVIDTTVIEQQDAAEKIFTKIKKLL